MLSWIGIEKKLLDISNEREHVELLSNSMGKLGIEVFYIVDEQLLEDGGGRRREVDFKQGLMIIQHTDCLAANLREQLPVIGYDSREGDSSIDGVTYVIESFEGIDIEYLQMVYHRFHQLPLTVIRKQSWLLRELIQEDISQMQKAGLTLLANIIGENELVSMQKEESECKQMRFLKAYIHNMYGFYGYGMWLAIKTESDKESMIKGKKTEEIIGMAGFDHIEEEALAKDSILRDKLQKQFCLQAGYEVCPGIRRQGYGLQFLKEITKYAFTHIGTDAVVVLIEPENLPSINLAKKAGFMKLEETYYRGKCVLVYIA